MEAMSDRVRKATQQVGAGAARTRTRPATGSCVPGPGGGGMRQESSWDRLLCARPRRGGGGGDEVGE